MSTSTLCPTTHPLKKPMSFHASSFLTARVGEEPGHEDFLLHEGMICKRSKFFRRAMNGNWLEGDARIVKLPANCPEIFGIYSNFVYTNEIVAGSECPTGEQPSLQDVDAEYLVLSQLYVLCEQLQDTGAKNAVMKALLGAKLEHYVDGKWCCPPLLAINVIYDGTVRGSPARRFVVDVYTKCSATSLESVQAHFPYDFVLELAVALRKLRGKTSNCPRGARDISRYTEEEEGQESEKMVTSGDEMQDMDPSVEAPL